MLGARPLRAVRAPGSGAVVPGPRWASRGGVTRQAKPCYGFLSPELGSRQGSPLDLPVSLEGPGPPPLPSSCLVVLCLNLRLPELGRCFWPGQLEQVPDPGSPGQHKPLSEEGNAQELRVDHCASVSCTVWGRVGGRRQPLRAPLWAGGWGLPGDCLCPRLVPLEAWRWGPGTRRAGWTLCCSSSGLGKARSQEVVCPARRVTLGGAPSPSPPAPACFRRLPAEGCRALGAVRPLHEPVCRRKPLLPSASLEKAGWPRGGPLGGLSGASGVGCGYGLRGAGRPRGAHSQVRRDGWCHLGCGAGRGGPSSGQAEGVDVREGGFVHGALTAWGAPCPSLGPPCPAAGRGLLPCREQERLRGERLPEEGLGILMGPQVVFS